MHLNFILSFILVVLLVALLRFGPKKLLKLGSGLGGAISGFKKAIREDEAGPAEAEGRRSDSAKTGTLAVIPEQTLTESSTPRRPSLDRLTETFELVNSALEAKLPPVVEGLTNEVRQNIAESQSTLPKQKELVPQAQRLMEEVADQNQTPMAGLLKELAQGLEIKAIPVSLDIPERGAVLSSEETPVKRFAFSGTNLSRCSWPIRGLLYSFLIHEIIVFGMPLMPALPGRTKQPGPTKQPLRSEEFQTFSPSRTRTVIYLPNLGGGSEGKGQSESGPGAPHKEPSVAPAQSTKGLSYPGAQHILSDSPKPTNRFQTILQPALKNPAVLPPPVPLPNIVQMAEGRPNPLVEPVKAPKPQEPHPASPPRVQPGAKATAPALPSHKLPTRTPTEPPKPSLPTSAPQNHPLPPESKPPEPAAKTAEKLKYPSRPEQHAPLPTRGPDPQNLLALSPLPAPIEHSVKVPSGEARGRFAISPKPNLTSSETGPGSKLDGIPSSAGGIGSQTRVRPGNAAAVSAAGVGAGSGAFPGITIQGGRLEKGTAGKPASHTGSPVPPQTSYGLTIVSTANSGGGLADFGVFSHEQVYTVYLDMRQTLEEPAPSWTLQYAVLREAASQEGAAKSSSPSQEGLVPPFPVAKELPQLPVDLVRRYLHRLIVVFAIIDSKGKLEQLSVKQSPDIQLKKPLFEALSKWVFRPAELNGEPVSVKVLLGIPLWLSE